MGDWQEYLLDELLETLIDYRGKSPKKSGTGIPVISAKVVKDGRILHPIEQTIEPTYYAEWMRRGYPRAGDVVLTTEGPLGEVAQLDSRTAKYALGQRIVVLRGQPDVIDNTFLKYLLLSPIGQERLSSYATGTTVEGISQKSLRKLRLPVPPIGQQRQIAELLGSLDDKIELNRQMNETLETMAQAIYYDWFVDFGPTRRKIDGASDPVEIMGGLVTDAERAQQLADLFPATFGDNGLPEGWNRKPLLDEAQLISGGTPKTDRQEYWDGGIAWASAKDVSQCGETYLLTTERTISEAGLENSSTKLVPQFSTAVVARGATTGRLCMFGEVMTMNQTCYALSSRSKRPFLLNNMFKALVDSLVQAAHGSVFDTITTKTLATANVLEAERASAAFEEIATPFYRTIENNARQCRTLAQTRDLLLPKLMSSEIRLREAEERLEAAQ